jgi:ABC-type Fe3+/spermidine/putrescine transport system ATPase subunit
MLRPEEIRLGDAPESAARAAIVGRIAGQAFLGSGIRYEIALADGTHVVAVRERGAQGALQQGDEVSISWSQAAVRFFPESGETS